MRKAQGIRFYHLLARIRTPDHLRVSLACILLRISRCPVEEDLQWRVVWALLPLTRAPTHAGTGHGKPGSRSSPLCDDTGDRYGEAVLDSACAQCARPSATADLQRYHRRVSRFVPHVWPLSWLGASILGWFGCFHFVTSTHLDDFLSVCVSVVQPIRPRARMRPPRGWTSAATASP